MCDDGGWKIVHFRMVSAWQLSIVMRKVAKMPTDSIQENIEIEVQSFEKQKERLCVRWELMKIIIMIFTFNIKILNNIKD